MSVKLKKMGRKGSGQLTGALRIVLRKEQLKAWPAAECVQLLWLMAAAVRCGWWVLPVTFGSWHSWPLFGAPKASPGLPSFLLVGSKWGEALWRCADGQGQES